MEQASAYARQGEPVPLSDPDHPVALTLQLRILALGPTQVYRGDQALTSTDWKYTKTKELLFYLLSYESRTREQIGADLWPEASPTQLRNDLKVAVYHLRRALGQSEWIVFDDQHYSFNRSLTYQFDVESFQSQLARARLVKNNPQALQALQEAMRLYRGEFLQDIVAGDWCLARREELRKSYLEALLSLGELLFAEARYSLAADVYSQVIACDSYLETAHRELMRCWARQGERGRALRHFHNLSQLLRDELGAAPAPETVALFECLQRGDENY
jgi:DNA-binding SARP family transcriptional activator